MNIEDARKIIADENTDDVGASLEAVAAMARFYAISHPKLLEVAKDLEQMAREIAVPKEDER